MINNKKGQTIIVSIMIGIIILITAVVLIEPTKKSIENSRNTSNVNCTQANDENRDSYENAVCIIQDVGLMYFISICLALSVAFISGKKNIIGIITSIFVFVVVTVLISPLKEWINLGRSALMCGTSGITPGVGLLCLFFDVWLFYFVITAISTGILYIAAKRVNL
jgi:hypothetical protein